MTIQPIGAASVALYLTPDDLKKHGLTPEEITRDLALTLTRHAFAQAGMTMEGPLEIEAYPDPCGVLVFARQSGPRRHWFTFPDLETLLTAARAVERLCPSEAALLYCQGAYWLSLPAEAKQAACILTEFGTAMAYVPFLEARLAEHGSVLLPSQALSTMLQYFPE